MNGPMPKVAVREDQSDPRCGHVLPDVQCPLWLQVSTTPMRQLRAENQRLRKQVLDLTSDRDAALSELSEAYELLLMGAETEVLNQELNNKVKQLEASQAEAERLSRELQDFVLQMMRTLGDLIEGRDSITAGHCERLVQYAHAIAAQMRIEESERNCLTYGAYMHDIGKLAIPDAILLKPGKLTVEEYEQMKEHTVWGWKLMSNTSRMEGAALIVRHHHEHYDGSGYPDGLVGEQIPLTARVMGLVDVFDALTTRRPYKDPFPLDKAFEIIRCDTGAHFDPLVVDAFFEAFACGRLTLLSPDLDDAPTLEEPS